MPVQPEGETLQEVALVEVQLIVADPLYGILIGPSEVLAFMSAVGTAGGGGGAETLPYVIFSSRSIRSGLVDVHKPSVLPILYPFEIIVVTEEIVLSTVTFTQPCLVLPRDGIVKL